MSPSEKIRALLDERGIEWWSVESLDKVPLTVCVIDGVRYKFRPQGRGIIVSSCTEGTVTAEQAIAATVSTEPDEETMLKLHDRMNAALLDYESAMGIKGGNGANTVPFVIDMHQIIEDAATVGVGTCKDVCASISEFTCSECGFNCDLMSWISLFDGDDGRHRHHHHGTPNFCPKCGARVVSE